MKKPEITLVEGAPGYTLCVSGVDEQDMDEAYESMINALMEEYKELHRELPFRHKNEQDNVSERMDKIKQALRNAGVTE